MKSISWFTFLLAIKVSLISAESDIEISEGLSSTFQIEGKIAPPDPKPKDWYWATRIYLDGGKRMAFLKVTFAFFFQFHRFF